MRSIVPMIAKRFVMSKHGEKFLSFISLVSVAGVGLGVLALVVVTSVINGFEQELVRVVTSVNADVILYSRGVSIGKEEEVGSRIRQLLNVEELSPGFVTEIMISGRDGVAGAVLQGVDLSTIGKVTRIPQQILRGRMPSAAGEVLLGKTLAERLGADVGSWVKLIAPFSGDSEPDDPWSSMDAVMSAPRVEGVTVVGIAALGMHEYDSRFVMAPLPMVQEFLNEPNRLTSYRIKLKNPEEAAAASATLSDSFGYPYRAKYWGELNENLFLAIQIEKAVIAVILTAIVVVAAFNVLSTLMMMIYDKGREIAILRSMGFPRSSSFNLFVLIGLAIGSAGISIGVASAVGLNRILEKTRWVDLPDEIYHLDRIPIVERWSEIGVVVVVSLLICFTATLFPAIKIARRIPVEGLKKESQA